LGNVIDPLHLIRGATLKEMVGELLQSGNTAAADTIKEEHPNGAGFGQGPAHHRLPRQELEIPRQFSQALWILSPMLQGWKPAGPMPFD
jgi:hypothetical protein